MTLLNILYIRRISPFLRDETGAITVDWTVLAASVVGLGLSSAAAVRLGTSNMAGDINTALSGAAVAVLGEMGSDGSSSDGSGGTTYGLLEVTEDEFASYLAGMAGYDEATLRGGYESALSWVQSNLDSGNLSNARFWMDQALAWRTSLESRDLELPDVPYDYDDFYSRLSS